MTSDTNKITDIVLDFDGTCTVISAIYKQFMEGFREKFSALMKDKVSSSEWELFSRQVRDNSPDAGWMLAGCPAAPSAADPFILSDETAKLILRLRKKNMVIPSTIHSEVYAHCPAPWRPDVKETIYKFLEKNINVHFLSNSGTKKVTERLIELFGEIPKNVTVSGDAAKFKICELTWEKKEDIPSEIRKKFTDLPAEFDRLAVGDLKRPVYLHRGSYFEAIAKIFSSDWSKLSSTVFCGDICEMDLAMPYYLGANIHLIEREEPFPVYEYEKNIIKSAGNRGRMSTEFAGILEWV
ncbi:hypothetical protein BH10BAC5_BH10BAC5_07460 [soil metagenome]